MFIPIWRRFTGWQTSFKFGDSTTTKFRNVGLTMVGIHRLIYFRQFMNFDLPPVAGSVGYEFAMSYGGSMLTPTIPGTGSRGFKILHLQHSLWSLLKLPSWTDPIPGILIDICIYIYLYIHIVYICMHPMQLLSKTMFFLFDLVWRVVPPKVKSQRRKHSSTTWDLGIKKPLKLVLKLSLED